MDLQATQPTLMAAMAGDAKLLADCKSYALHRDITSHLKVDRDHAKKAFMAYASGKIRGNWHGHRDVCQVQELMKNRYPTAAGFAEKEKRDKGYRQLSCDLQNKEAEMFVDGMLGTLTHDGLPALTVHDSLYVRCQDAGRATEIAHDHQGKFIPNNLFTLECEIITTR